MEDEPVIKPRRARGTPFLKFRNRFALGFAVVGFVIHSIATHFKKDEISRKFAVGWYDETPYAKDRKAEFRASLPVSSAKNSTLHQLVIEDSLSGEMDADSPIESDLGD